MRQWTGRLRIAMAMALMAAGVVAVTPAPAGAADGLPTAIPGGVVQVEGGPGTTVIEFPLNLSAPSTQTVTVQWSTIFSPTWSTDIAAIPGDDYQAASGQVVFAPGQTSQTAQVSIDGDLLGEADEWLVVAFDSPTNAHMGGYWGLGFGVILDDDAAPADTDGDGVVDAVDNCPNAGNADQADYDNDGVGDACDPDNTDGPDGDTDGDGLTNGDEVDLYGTDPANPDTDGDGSPDGNEIDFGTDPLVDERVTPPTDDADGDFIADSSDNCPSTPNFPQADGDGDGIGDACDPDVSDGPEGDPDGDGLTNRDEVDLYGTDTTDPDTDGDGSPDGREAIVGTDPLSTDTDGDGVPDGDDNCPFASNPAQADADHDFLGDACDTDPNADRDNDRLTDGQEVNIYGTDPNDADTDDDSESDGQEVLGWRTDPNDADTDDDGVDDGLEIFPSRRGGLDVRDKFTDPLLWDTDGDGLGDGEEWDLIGMVSPRAFDSDGDGLGDGLELALGFYPDRADADYDGLNDSVELALGTSPLSNDSDGDTFPDGVEAPRGQGQLSDPTDSASWPRSERRDLDRDGINDADDNCGPVPLPGYTPLFLGGNPSQIDLDLDGLGDLCDDASPAGQFRFDTDFDGINGADEVSIGLDPDDPDYDNDLLDGIELRFGSDPRATDTDSDGRLDSQEWIGVVSFPNRSDTDGDGLGDAVEVDVYGSNPRSNDSDLDGIPDGDEVTGGTDPTNQDTDGDGLDDGAELDPWGTDPLNPDTDGDGSDDGEEVEKETDPLDPTSTPPPTNPVSVDGSVTWQAPDGSMQPVRYATVIMEEEVRGVMVIRAETVTDENGDFEMALDPDLIENPYEPAARIRVKAEWKDRFTVIEKNPPDDKPYEKIESINEPLTAGALIFPAIEITAADGDIHGAFSIHAAAVVGYRFTEDDGYTIPELQFRYPRPATNYQAPGAADPSAIIRVESTVSDYIDVLLHEFGHHVSANLGFELGPGGAHLACATTSGTTGREALSRQAWGEGVATFLALVMSRENAILSAGFVGAGNSSYQDGGVPTDLEAACSNSDSFGMTDEGTVGGFLWDLYDAAADPIGLYGAVDDVQISATDLIGSMAATGPVEFVDFFTTLAADRAGGDPFDASFDAISCIAEEAGAVPSAFTRTYATGDPLDVSQPMKLEFNGLPDGFVFDNTPTRITVQGSDGTVLFETTVLANNLPRADGATGGLATDPRAYEFDTTTWSVIAGAGAAGHRITVGVEVGGAVVRGCPVEFGPFAP